MLIALLNHNARKFNSHMVISSELEKMFSRAAMPLRADIGTNMTIEKYNAAKESFDKLVFDNPAAIGFLYQLALEERHSAEKMHADERAQELLNRMSVRVKAGPMPEYAANDILIFLYRYGARFSESPAHRHLNSWASSNAHSVRWMALLRHLRIGEFQGRSTRVLGTTKIAT